MYVLIFVVLLIVILALSQVYSLEATTNIQSASEIANQTKSVATMGAQVFAACQKMPVGAYTQSEITSLPVGYPALTQIGNSWNCETASGGPYGYAHLVTWGAPPQYVGGKMSQSLAPGSQEANNLAFETAQSMYLYFKTNPSVLVGVVPAGSTTLDLINSYLTINMSGMITPQNYDMPVVVSGMSP